MFEQAFVEYPPNGTTEVEKPAIPSERERLELFLKMQGYAFANIVGIDLKPIDATRCRLTPISESGVEDCNPLS